MRRGNSPDGISEVTATAASCSELVAVAVGSGGGVDRCSSVNALVVVVVIGNRRNGLSSYSQATEVKLVSWQARYVAKASLSEQANRNRSRGWVNVLAQERSWLSSWCWAASVLMMWQ